MSKLVKVPTAHRLRWTDEFSYLSQPGQREMQAALRYDYHTNVACHPWWQAWLREHRPPTLIACPLDHVNHQFHAPAPNRLWISDFTYVSIWCGFAYVAFVIDAYARRIVG